MVIQGVKMRLKGTITAMITPFLKDELDEEGLVQNIRNQMKAGITGLLFLGSTGEHSTLTEKEQKRVIEIGVNETKGKALVLIGTGSNSTKHTVEMTQRAKDLGADIALVITPYYNKPSQEGIYRHFEAIATHVDLPVMVYNNQARTAVNIETTTLMRIAGLPHVIGVKEASGNMSQVGDVIQTICKKHPSFSVLSGDDVNTLPMMALGATGVISVISNLIPEQVISLVEAALAFKFDQAKQLHEEWLPFFKAVFIEVNPVPIKEAMNFYGMAAGNCRLPLCELRSENREKIKTLIADLKSTLKNTDSPIYL